MRVGYLTDRGRKRPTNEDSLRACEDLSFFMLADGVLPSNDGLITACDIHRHRLALIEAAMKRTGANIVRTRSQLCESVHYQTG